MKNKLFFDKYLASELTSKEEFFFFNRLENDRQFSKEFYAYISPNTNDSITGKNQLKRILKYSISVLSCIFVLFLTLDYLFPTSTKNKQYVPNYLENEPIIKKSTATPFNSIQQPPKVNASKAPKKKSIPSKEPAPPIMAQKESTDEIQPITIPSIAQNTPKEIIQQIAPPKKWINRSPLGDKYVANYAHIAVQEMERTAIPASITLAQGMLESGYETSELAVQANNHFGIKCHKGWDGETYTHYSKENMTSSSVNRTSCFRAYKSVAASYRDHSDFLASRSNYMELFLKNTNDYKVWAKGLLNGGYATDPNYAKKLIAAIEAYQLNAYDLASSVAKRSIKQFKDPSSSSNYILISQERSIDCFIKIFDSSRTIVHETYSTKTSSYVNTKDWSPGRYTIETTDYYGNSWSKEIIIEGSKQPEQRSGFITSPQEFESGHKFIINGIKMTQVTSDKNLFEIAKQYDIPFKDLLKYNDLEDDSELPNGAYVFLATKINKSLDHMQHKVQANESIHSISQRYGIKLRKLQARNHLRKQEEPAKGEIIFLNKRNPQKPALK